MRGQNHVHRRATAGRTDGQTDGQGETNVPTKLHLGGEGMMMSVLPVNGVH